MKTKLFALVACAVMSFTVQAQILRGGVNLANISTTNEGDFDEANMLTSFQVGILGDWKLLPMLYFQPGIIFSGKGSKTQDGQESDPTFFRATSNPYYIEIPANLVFKTPGAIKFFAGGGPYLGIGIAGKNEVDGKFLGTSFHSEEDIEFSNDDPSTLDYEEGAGYGILKRFDYGVNLTAGIQFTKFVLALGYGHGLAKLQSGSNSSADDKNKHRVVSVTLGLRL